MTVFKREGIIAYKVGEKVYHPQCYKSIKKTSVVDDVVTQDQLEDHIFICDRCGEEIE